MKKIFNKALSVILATIFVTTICFFDNVNAYAVSAKKGKLSAQVATTIYVGSQKNITTKYNKKRVKKGVKYKSSNKKTATVSKNGKIKAIKKGSSKITVTYKKKSVVLKVTVKDKSTTSTSATTKSKKSFKIGSKTVKFNTKNNGIILGTLKSKKGYIYEYPIAYKRGYKFLGWYKGNDRYDYITKISKSITLNPKYRKLKTSDYTDMVDLDYLKIYNKSYYDELQVVMVDSKKGWKNNTEVKKYYVKNLISRGYCPSTNFNPTAYIKIVKSKYGIELSSYKEAFDFYLGCGEENYDKTTLKCIHEGGTFNDSFTDTELDYYPNNYERYEPMGDNYAMMCGECGKYFYGPTKHDDWDTHMFYICNVLGLPGSGWAWAWDIYDIFYKKEDHEHTDTMKRTYCQNEGKKVSQKLLKREYTPYRTDVPISYPPDGPVWWYVDKF